MRELAATTDVDIRTTADGVTVSVGPWPIGLAWHAWNLVLTGAGRASTIKILAQNEGRAESIFFCVTGLVSTIISVRARYPQPRSSLNRKNIQRLPRTPGCSLVLSGCGLTCTNLRTT